ncbi:DUF1634 domain-containing protein [Pedobacter sp. Leaf250]|uniref:DUF1634 domain-containing protein n=1 Tax=Pedobacter sp. Leaf250 TaxID=2876559 RepID=UPI001206DF7B|nr:DUF1634 domain-containing protein [Pedobacter sp. Leaf250]RZL46855.1 MAG: DUF1634 domain-containing protein [Pedobacter sp.]
MKKEINASLEQDRDVEKTVGKLLRAGVILASLVVFIGGLSYVFSFGSLVRPDYHSFKGEESNLITFAGIFKGFFSGEAKGIIQFGVLLLILTPILRIIFSLFAFAIERDKLYVFITLIVLGIILASTFGGLNI